MLAEQLVLFARSVPAVDVRIPNGINLASVVIANVAVDEKAGPGDLAWISPAAAQAQPARIQRFRGSALICPTGAVDLAPDGCIVLGSAAPKELLARVLAQFFSHLAATLWPTGTVTVADDAKVGARVRMGAGVVIGPRVEIGDDVTIGPNTCIAHSTIGPRVTIGANCSLGLDGFGYARDAAGRWMRVPHVGVVQIGADVEIGSNSCIDRGTLGATMVGAGAKIDNLVHLAHNCVIGENSVVIANSMVGGGATVGPGSWIAPSVSINNKLVVSDGATVGTGAVVIRDVAAGSTVVGNPARVLPNKGGHT